MEILSFLCLIFTALVIGVTARVIYLLIKIFTTECALYQDSNLRTIFCIGSGGHTTELLRFMRNLNCRKYYPRLYILADNDINSESKIFEAENKQSTYLLNKIPRSRKVNQSYFSSVFSTIYSTLITVPVIYKFKPNVIFCNGPGTCIPICVVAFILRILFLLDCRIVFIESICRVRSLSLTGKILQYFADLVVVQWPQLRDVSLRAKYFGRLT
ncbi:UDP-N-acetylglucosamine transferase subunit ALG14 homolog [Bombyx mori]|uniref:UDP-N-acetylglucosamine transferase subunit ALG14 n=1 Tax=Bombyx mori TaxID=7091 RepID=A0A8R1WL04_BOMMO|nr:UDP-N-acetylglucosamine transferase subunit ALG14 homolog [Bombyx mori]